MALLSGIVCSWLRWMEFSLRSFDFGRLRRFIYCR